MKRLESVLESLLTLKTMVLDLEGEFEDCEHMLKILDKTIKKVESLSEIWS